MFLLPLAKGGWEGFYKTISNNEIDTIYSLVGGIGFAFFPKILERIMLNS